MTPFLARARTFAEEPRFGFDLVRIYLGVALFVRGALFIADPSRVISFFGKTDWFWPMLIAHYVGMAHLCGGLFLALGLLTRFAALAQVPVLVGAVFFVHWNQPLLSGDQSLELAGLVLALLVSYVVFGAGPLSVDQRLFRATRARERSEWIDQQRQARGRRATATI
jgi:putative oxidoreductase